MILIVLVLTADFLKIGENYIFHLQGGFDYFYKEIVDNFNYFEKKKGKSLVLQSTRPDFSPYIFFAFYQKMDPFWFLDKVKWYPPDEEGFRHVAEISSQYQFGPIDWGQPVKREVVYVDLYQDIPSEIKELGGIETKIIKSKNGKPLFLQFVY